MRSRSRRASVSLWRSPSDERPPRQSINQSISRSSSTSSFGSFGGVSLSDESSNLNRVDREFPIQTQRMHAWMMNDDGCGRHPHPKEYMREYTVYAYKMMTDLLQKSTGARRARSVVGGRARRTARTAASPHLTSPRESSRVRVE